MQSTEASTQKQMHELHAKIGQFIVERDFLADAWSKRWASRAVGKVAYADNTQKSISTVWALEY